MTTSAVLKSNEDSIAKCAENGKVAIVFGGVDCDGVNFDNCVAFIKADIESYDLWISESQRAADGPMWCRLEKPSIAKNLRPLERDLMMEAFENGHPQTLKM